MDSLIYESAVSTTVSLDPSQLSDVKASILGKLNDTLLNWDDELSGIVLSYRKVKIHKNALGFVGLGDYVHYKVSYVATYFKPEKGKLWTGKVTNISESGINILVLDLINWRIIEPEGDKGEQIDSNTVEKFEKLVKPNIVQGDMVKFKIEDIQASNNAIMLYGSLPK